MVKAGVPTAAFEVVTDVDATMKAAVKFTPPYVLKADGLAAGKGVFSARRVPELKAAAESLFEARSLGSAGLRAILEQFQPDMNCPIYSHTNGEEAEALPLAQDLTV